MKMYAFTGLLAMLLYPFAWYFLLGPLSISLIYGDWILGTSFTAGIAFASVISLYIFRMIANEGHPVFQAFVVRFLGAVASGFISAFVIYALKSFLEGALAQVDFNWFLTMHLPGFVSTFVAYWIVSLLVTPVHIVAVKVPVRRM